MYPAAILAQGEIDFGTLGFSDPKGRPPLCAFLLTRAHGSSMSFLLRLRPVFGLKLWGLNAQLPYFDSCLARHFRCLICDNEGFPHSGRRFYSSISDITRCAYCWLWPGPFCQYEGRQENPQDRGHMVPAGLFSFQAIASAME